MSQSMGAGFNGLVDLAAAEFGGVAVATNDEFFAEASNLLLAEPAVFITDKYTDRGKWMDGWESRRKRGPGHDWCWLELGVAGEVAAFDIDTSHFVGNHPAFAAVDGASLAKGATLGELEAAETHALLAQAPLLPGSHNLFVAKSAGSLSHLRLSIFPDGGVARFRAYGKVTRGKWRPPELDAETRARAPAGVFDLAALGNGALALACSDARFGGMNNLLLPGRSANMGSGWETRRRRGPGDDWLLIELGARGTPELIEVDTHHFKGNFPDRCSLELIDAEGARPTELIASEAWQMLLPETKLQAHARHFFDRELLTRSAATHLRLRIFPDGGISRLRVWGKLND